MASWLEKDLKFVWHPYTQMKDALSFPPILIERARGIKLYDSRGRGYYDAISSWWCNVHGHNHPVIKKALRRQMSLLEHTLFAGFTHRGAIALAEKLVSFAPKRLNKVFFSDDGSTAVEVALKMSLAYWRNSGLKRKTKFVSLEYSYHGDTVGAMSVSGVGLFNEPFAPLFFPSFKAPAPYCYRCPMGKTRNECHIDCLGPLERLLKDKSAEIAALILEPLVLAAGGFIIYPKEYLEQAGRLAKKYGVHLILDEVATGFGRTGEMFAAGHVENIRPDFMCLAKGLTAGYLPMAATLATDEVYRAFWADHAEKKTFYHGHTYTANPLGCAAALASMEVFKKERTLAHVREAAPFLRTEAGKFRDLPFIGDVRTLGMIAAFELVRDKKTKEMFPFEARIGFKVYREGLRRGIILRPLGHVVYLFPPLCVTRKDLQKILNKTYLAVKCLNQRKFLL